MKIKKLKEEKTVWSRVWALSPRGLIYLPASSNYSSGLKFGLTQKMDWTDGGIRFWGKGWWRGRSRGAITLRTLRNRRQSWNGDRIRYSDTKWTNMAMTETTQRPRATVRAPVPPPSDPALLSPRRQCNPSPVFLVWEFHVAFWWCDDLYLQDLSTMGLYFHTQKVLCAAFI